MVTLENYKDEKGGIDWKAYRQAQIDNGDKCFRCESYVYFSKSAGHKVLCSECRDIQEKEELSHSIYIRCPKCSYAWEPRETEDYKLYEDGDHYANCPECQHDFKIQTQISYLFISPELIEKPVEESEL